MAVCAPRLIPVSDYFQYFVCIGMEQILHWLVGFHGLIWGGSGLQGGGVVSDFPNPNLTFEVSNRPVMRFNIGVVLSVSGFEICKPLHFGRYMLHKRYKNVTPESLAVYTIQRNVTYYYIIYIYIDKEYFKSFRASWCFFGEKCNGSIFGLVIGGFGVTLNVTVTFCFVTICPYQPRNLFCLGLCRGDKNF